MIEWYFEITKNSIDEQGKPFYDPLYLDIAFLPDFSIECQRDEFKKALATKIITDSDYKIANNTCTKIIKEVILRKEDLTIFFNKYLSCLESQTYKTKR
jgi:predicted RNA-binding protein associated with RNAse of E/G family